jgi:hypothetical protein
MDGIQILIRGIVYTASTKIRPSLAIRIEAAGPHSNFKSAIHWIHISRFVWSFGINGEREKKL